MAIMGIFFGLWQILTLNVQPFGYELDEETRERMEQRAEMLNREMTRLWQEVEEMYQEQRNQEQTKQEQSRFAWASLLLSALQHWQCWAIAGVLVLLFGLCWRLRKWSREPEREEKSSGNNRKEQQQEKNPRRLSADPAQRRVQKRERRCKAVKNLMEKLIILYNRDVFNTRCPVLEKPIEVGSTFEGWSPRKEELTYRLLVPLKPPRGHIFHLEPCPWWPVRNFCIRVDSVCTCEMEPPAGETRCFLHDPEEEQRRKEGHSILQDLCTNSYLDVQKTAEWFQKTVRCCWKDLPESAIYRLMMLPSDRSCKFWVLTQGWDKICLIELMFGVQEGDSDLFVSNQHIEAAYTPRTLWPETSAVADMKFFRHIASQAQPDTCHLRCLQLYGQYLLGRDFYTYIVKTVVMHLLTTVPLSKWSNGMLLRRLDDIMLYLQRCLQNRRLNHFFIGNDNLPEEINLPLELRTAEPFNLFQDLDHEKTSHDFQQVQRQLRGLLMYRH